MNKNWDTNIKLYSLYKSLLPQKQQDYFEASYYNDLSISEIADMYNVSRTAVHDGLAKAETKLLEYEKSLKLMHKKQKRQELYSKIHGNQEIIVKLMELEENDEF